MNTPRIDSELEVEAGPAKLGAARIVLRVLLPLLMVFVGWKAYTMLSIEPEKAKRPHGKPRALRSKVIELKVEDYQTVINTQGLISAHNEITLTAQVGGQIIYLGDGFEDGAFFSKGDVLVELDPAVYAASLKGVQAQLAQANAGYAQEKARGQQAALNWIDLGYNEEPNELVLRKPQLREAEARVDSAAAQLERAQRDLDLTKIRAPFDGRVLRRSVGVSQAIGAGTPLGTIFAIDFAEVRLPISPRSMAFLDLPESPQDVPVDIELMDALTSTNPTVWKAQIIRTEGALDASSLELYAIARINDPFGRNTGMPPLRIGQPVSGAIPGKPLEKVVSVPRSAVRQLNKINLIDKDELTLSSRTLTPIWSTEDHLVVRDPTIPDGALLAMSNLVYSPEGAKVEIIPDVEPIVEAETAANTQK